MADENKAPAKSTKKDGPGVYKVTMGGVSKEFEARDPNEAWALFCDDQKKWPSPKFTKRQIVKV